jgi:hypothetical protein
MMNGVGVLSSRLNAGRLDVRTGVRTTLRQSGMDSNVQFRALDRQRIRSSWGRSTGAPVIRAVAGLGIPIDLSGGGPRSRHSPPGSGGVTPGLRCRRCERIAEPMVRIRSPPARSLLRTSLSGRIPSENRGSESSPLDNTGKLLGERLHVMLAAEIRIEISFRDFASCSGSFSLWMPHACHSP